VSGERGGSQEIPRPPGMTPGAPAPWATLPAERLALTLPGVRDALARRGPARAAPFEAPGARASAVLVPLYDHGTGLHVVLTRRAAHLRFHRGEVSFPGGGQDPDDPDLVATALRESQEEIGLDPDGVEIVGELDHLATLSSRSAIVPFVGALPARPELSPNPNEVEHILHVPVAELLLEEVYREERWGPDGERRSMHFFELHGDTVWGATARILHQLLCVVTGATEA
jgi:8-oxo-dGTP pyrophosphatase MutT (NUDIX family)